MQQNMGERDIVMDLRNLSISINKHNNFTHLVQVEYSKSKQEEYSKSKQEEYSKSKQVEYYKSQQQSSNSNNGQQQHKQHLRHVLQQQQSIVDSNKQHLLVVEFDFIQLQPLTTLIQQINLFTLHTGINTKIQANLKLSKLFHLQTLNYFIEIQSIKTNTNISKNISKNTNVKTKTNISNSINTITQPYTIVETKQQQLNTLKHNVKMHFILDNQLNINNNTTITLIVANDQNKYPFIIQKFITYTKVNNINQNNNNRQFQQSMQKPIFMNLSIQNDYSYPLIDQLQLPKQQLNQVQYLSQQINQLKHYQSPNQSSLNHSSLVEQKRLYICHDMKGGYKQDINTYNPIQTTNTQTNKSNNNNHNNKHSYRFDYLSQTKIFNYFSHYPITIPPKSWRLLCKRYNSLCLGTFIVQPNQHTINQDDFMTEQFALKLIYIAKKAQFDGYLINIQIPIQNTHKLIHWLKYLTTNINNQIKNSQIIWYDSIIYNTGQIKYQNQLNQHNHTFYQNTNGLFTNYWWNQTSLTNTIKYKDKSKQIYIGNDCWGRNTYGGGKYDLYKAINKIHQLSKNQLSIALFAPAYTYQDNAQSLIQTFTQNQLKMYHGYNVQTKNINKWKITLNGGQGWKQQAEWAVVSYQLCQRQALIDIKAYQGKSQRLTIFFSCIVTGTGPNYADYYKITLQLYDYINGVVYYQQTHPKTVATSNQERIQIKMEIDSDIITEGVCLRLLQEGKDAEFWAGHFGTRLKGQQIVLSTQNKIKNWIPNIPIKAVNLNKPYITFFNKGQGTSFYYKGDKMKVNYDSLSDYDFPPVYSLNNPSDIQVQYKVGFIGGSCLRFINTNKILINKFYSQSNNQIQPRQFNVIVTVKETEIVAIQYGSNKKQLKYNTIVKSVRNSDNNWKSYTFELSLQKQDNQFYIQLNLSKTSGLIGHFGIFNKGKDKNIVKNHKNQQVKQNLTFLEEASISFDMNMKLSHKPKYISPYCLDIKLTSTSLSNQTNFPQRLLLKIGQFSGFINLDRIKQKDQIYQLKGYLKSIPILNNIIKQIEIEIININQMEFNVTMKNIISLDQIKKLTQNKHLTFEFKI